MLMWFERYAGTAGNKNVVARDGIEPPTPAFSGPRSTTELPGLSADFVANSCAGSGWTGKVGVSANSALQQLCQYINSLWLRQTCEPVRNGSIISSRAAEFSVTTPYTGWQLCFLQSFARHALSSLRLRAFFASTPAPQLKRNPLRRRPLRRQSQGSGPRPGKSNPARPEPTRPLCARGPWR